MFQKFYPSEYYDSTYQIPFEQYYKEGYRGVLFDIDNTLVPHGKPADERAKTLICQLKEMGYQVCVMSNNKEIRVKDFCEAVGAEHYIFKANKPSVKSYVSGMKRMGTTKETTLFVGDQLFTDIYGANRVGIRSLLVKPIHPKEEIQIVLKRYLEKIVLRQYKKRKKTQL